MKIEQIPPHPHIKAVPHIDQGAFWILYEGNPVAIMHANGSVTEPDGSIIAYCPAVAFSRLFGYDERRAMDIVIQVLANAEK